MSEPLPITRLRHLHRDLAKLVAERARKEPELEREYEARRAQAERDGESAQKATFDRFVKEKDALTEEWKRARQAAAQGYQDDTTRAQQEYAKARHNLLVRLSRTRRGLKNQIEEASWTANAVLEGGKTAAETKRREDRAQVEAQME